MKKYILNFTQAQITEIIESIINEADGLNKILQTNLETMMKSEGEIFNPNYSIE